MCRRIIILYLLAGVFSPPLLADEEGPRNAVLTVAPYPEDARVRVMNIKPRYRPKMRLVPGAYDIEVAKPGYVTYRQWANLKPGDRVMRVSLQPVGQPHPPRGSSRTAAITRIPGQAVSVARYSTIRPQPTHFQRNPLDAVIGVDFARNIATVGAAVNTVLSGSGYGLAAGDAADPKLPTLLQLPLPDAHRQLGPISVHDALATLAGPAWRLVVDPVNRLVSYEVSDQYITVTRSKPWKIQ